MQTKLTRQEQLDKFVGIARDNSLDFTETKQYITKYKMWNEFPDIHEKINMSRGSRNFIIDGIDKNAYGYISRALDHDADSSWKPQILD